MCVCRSTYEKKRKESSLKHTKFVLFQGVPLLNNFSSSISQNYVHSSFLNKTNKHATNVKMIAS